MLQQYCLHRIYTEEQADLPSVAPEGKNKTHGLKLQEVRLDETQGSVF